MKQVRVFKTEDGKLFDESEREEAMQHELMLNIRGILQSSKRDIAVASSDPMTIAATILAARQENVYTTMQSYRRSIAGVRANKAKND